MINKSDFLLIFTALCFFCTMQSAQARLLVVGKNAEFRDPQSAFNSCTDGDEIEIQAGTYTSSGNVSLVNKKNIKITGKGTVWIVASELSWDVVRLVSCENITMSNIRMRHAKPDRKDKDVNGCGGRVLSFEGGKNIRVSNCEMNGCGRIGVDFTNYKSDADYENIVLSKNKIHKNSLCAIHYQDNLYFSERDVNIAWLTLNQNTIENNGK